MAYTEAQKNVINSRGKNMLVSASAGTGKTTVMIERIAALLENEADVSELVVVTFTNLAAAEMKNRLSLKLAEKRNDPRIVDQLERIDSANISTLHSFCGNLLRNYFYVVDIDPSFDILDSMTVAKLKNDAMDRIFSDYFFDDDKEFKKVYKIFSKKRSEDRFRDLIMQLSEFGSCLGDFSEWYAHTRRYITEYAPSNPVARIILQDIKQSVKFYYDEFNELARRCADGGFVFEKMISANANAMLGIYQSADLAEALQRLNVVALEKLPPKAKKKDYGGDKELENNIRDIYKELEKDYKEFAQKYASFTNGKDLIDVWKQMAENVYITDKLAEIVTKFDAAYFALKKERGGLDFADLEKLTLRVLNDTETLENIKSKYKMFFVDEYQDTNPIQEEIISRLTSANNLFMVGDVKQSIYGFRGCEPSIFVDKYNRYKETGEGEVHELNDNFRSDKKILQFVNSIFEIIMTEDFGKVNYARDAKFRGESRSSLSPSVRLDLLLKPKKEEAAITSVYDITVPEDYETVSRQGELVAKRVNEYVGKTYVDPQTKEEKIIGYGDIVILMRSLTDKAIDIYNALLSKNIPVAANFKVNGLQNKEVRDIITLLRVIDNPYNDVYMMGVCLTCFGGFDESELGEIRLDALGNLRVSFYDRLKEYAKSGTNAIIRSKINALTAFLAQLRFYSRSASVSEVVLRILRSTDYGLYVQGLPNGALRLNKLYSFVDSLTDANYAKSIDGFLSYIDETEDERADEGISCGNAVRLMTMHASKGLEFPVVIIPALEKKFRFDSEEVERNFNLGFFVKRYDFASMRSAQNLGYYACKLANMQKQREEEMRTLYVAMTRAKYALNLIGMTSEKEIDGAIKMPSNANTFMDWILGGIKKYHRNIRSLTSDLYEINIFEDVIDGEKSVSSEMAEQTYGLDELEKDIAYKYPHEKESRMPSKMASSTLDRIYLDAESAPAQDICQNDIRNKVGTAYHKVYQYVDYNADVDGIEETIRGLTNQGIIEKEYADMLDRNKIFDTLNNPNLRKLTDGGTVYHEVPFMISVAYNDIIPDGEYRDETMLQGVIDLLIIKDDKAIVVDFKYTSHSDKIEKNYALQINSYKLAVQRICGITDVDCYVLSIDDNKIIHMKNLL